MDELINAFSIDRVGKSGSRFDPEKAKWFNHQYMQKKSSEELAGLFIPLLKEKGFTPSADSIVKLVSLVKERAVFVTDLWKESDFFFIAPESYDAEVLKKRWKDDSPAMLTALRGVVAAVDPFTAEEIEKHVKEWIATENQNAGNVFNLFRLLLVGASRGPHIFDIAAWIGREETLRRLDKGVERLSAGK